MTWARPLPAIVGTLHRSPVIFSREPGAAERLYTACKVGDTSEAVRMTLPESRLGVLTGAVLLSA